MGPVAGAHDQQIVVPGPRDDTLAHMHPVLQYYLDPDLHVLSQAEHPQTDAPGAASSSSNMASRQQSMH